MDGNTEELLKNLEKLGIGTSLQKKRDPKSTASVGGASSSSSSTKPVNRANKDIPTFSSSTSTQPNPQATSSNTKPEVSSLRYSESQPLPFPLISFVYHFLI